MLKFAMVYTVFHCRTHCFNVRLLKPYIYIVANINLNRWYSITWYFGGYILLVQRLHVCPEDVFTDYQRFVHVYDQLQSSMHSFEFCVSLKGNCSSLGSRIVPNTYFEML